MGIQVSHPLLCKTHSFVLNDGRLVMVHWDRSELEGVYIITTFAADDPLETWVNLNSGEERRLVLELEKIND